MTNKDTDKLLEDATAQESQLPEPPLRPQKEYEDITIRQITIGFPGQPPQDFTLYPEDTLQVRDDGYTYVEFKTLGGGVFEAFPEHVAWRSYRELPHKREKGVLRPDPRKLMEDLRAEKVGRI